jgi:hypothetical protein
MDTDNQAAAAAPEGMSDTELVALLERMRNQAVDYYNGDVAAEQERALHYYYGRPFGDEEDGRSRVVDLTVATVIENAVSAMLKPFVSGETPAEFNPVGPEDEKAAEQASDYVSHVIMHDNDGFGILMTAAKDGLLQKLGIAKVYWQDKTAPKRERVIVSADEFEAVAQEVVEGPFETEQPGVFEVVVERQYEDGCVTIDCVPNDEFRISPLSRDVKSSPYLAHIVHRTRSELVALGFDRDAVYALSKSDKGSFDDPRTLARWEDEDEAGSRAGIESDASQEQIEVCHEFPLLDMDGDGISERREIIRCGEIILYNEEVEDHPFVCWCPVPVPHKVYGRSYGDLTVDEQRVRSVLIRQQLDNLYLNNNPATELPEAAERTDGSTTEALLSREIGRVIPTRMGGQIQPVVIPFVADKAFTMLEASERRIMGRTGVSLVGQGLDPETLQRERTATEAQIDESGRDERLEMVARIFGVQFVGELYKKVLRLVVQNQPRERVMRLRNEWVPMDPRSWNAKMDVTVNVGLGADSKKEKLAQASMALEMIERLAMSPFGPMMVKPENAYEATKRFLEAIGIHNPEAMISEPTPEVQQQMAEQQANEPDPETMKVQAEMQLKQADLQMRQQEAAAKIEFAREEAAAKLQLMREEAAAKAQLERDRAEAEALLAQQQAEREFAMAQQRMAMEMQMARERMAMEAEVAKERAKEDHAAKVDAAKVSASSLPKKRPGGDLSK